MIDRPGPVVVTGCQRSGTMLAAQVIASGLGYGFLEEFDVLPQAGGLSIFSYLNDNKISDVVIQAPFAVKIYKQILSAAPTTHFVGVVRPRQEILASMKRIEWCKEDHEDWETILQNHIDKMLLLWSQLKKDVCPSSWTELKYEDLKGHPFFVDQNERQNFTVKQWQPNQPCNFKKWSNNKKCIEDRIKENIYK